MLVKFKYYTIYVLLIFYCYGAELYVSKSLPVNSTSFRKIQAAVNASEPGDIIFIREGRYSEHVRVEKKKATSQSPLRIEAWPNERVVIDGTVPITSYWEPYNHNGLIIYRTSLDSTALSDSMGDVFRGVWQLFLNDRMMIPSQLINLKNPTDPRVGTASQPEPNTYWDAGDEFYGGDGRIYPDNTTNLLSDIDSPEEWCYLAYSQEIYLYPPNGINPNNSEVRGRVRDAILNVGGKNKNSRHISFKGIQIFAGKLWAYRATNISFVDCRFSYSITNNLPIMREENGPVTKIGVGTSKTNYLETDCDSAVFRNCIFEYIDGKALTLRGSHYNIVENCYFHHINWSGKESVALRTQKAKYTTMRYITIDQNISGGGFYPSSYNIVDHCLVTNIYSRRDAAGIQVNQGQVEPVIRNTWVMDAPYVNGIRFDGNPGGVFRKIHHTLSIRTSRGYRLKGDQHQVHHIIGMESARHDISLPDYKFYGYWNPETGEATTDPSLGWPRATNLGEDSLYNIPLSGNLNTVHSNSIAEGAYECDRPTFTGCNEQKNKEWGLWHGVLKGENISYELSNPAHYDYRPRKGSSLIDAGVIIEGVNDGSDGSRKYVGDAPDIGTYEYGDNVYFIPGYRPATASFPIPPNNSSYVFPSTILAWRYPWPSDENTIAEVRVTGPGINNIESFQYPNNVYNGPFHPGGNYSWSVSVGGKSGGSWFFQVANMIEPDNDRSVANNLTTILTPKQENLLTVSASKSVFLKFTVEAGVDEFWETLLNLYVPVASPQGADVVIYRFNNTSWHERETSGNIGTVNRSLGSPIDTLLNIRRDRSVVVDVSNVIVEPGEYSFALALMGSNGRAEFCSKENSVSLRPHLSFTPGSNDVGIAPLEPRNDSTLVMETLGDSIEFSWNLSHDIVTENMTYEFVVSLPYLNENGTIDSLTYSVQVDGSSISVDFQELISMLAEAELVQGTFTWQVRGYTDNSTWSPIASHRLHLVTDEGDSETVFPVEYKLLHNYPNPFNANTTIVFDLKDWAKIRLEIYDIRGRNLRKLIQATKPPGRHSALWDGKDSFGRKTASGLYFVRLTAINPNTGKKVYRAHEKMMLVH
tara:strand:- start:5916 stop:9200 length:3285 start_codon:yes stop_codon:yes gene_type:complete